MRRFRRWLAELIAPDTILHVPKGSSGLVVHEDGALESALVTEPEYDKAPTSTLAVAKCLYMLTVPAAQEAINGLFLKAVKDAEADATTQPQEGEE